jgi:hypothetical protein
MRSFLALAGVLVLFLAPVAHSQCAAQWIMSYDGGRTEKGQFVLLDSAGYIYVVGQASNGSNLDILVMKVDPTSHLRLWTRTYNRGYGDDFPRDAALYGSTVYVTGQSRNANGNNDYVTIGFTTASGTTVGPAFYDGGRDDEAYGITVNSTGVYVTGESKKLVYDKAVTLRYNFSLAPQWTMTFTPGMNTYGTCITSDGSGTVYVGGCEQTSATNTDLLVVAYSSASSQLWCRAIDGPGLIETQADCAWDVACFSDRVLVTGQYNGVSTGLDYGTLALSKSTGSSIWIKQFNGYGSGNDTPLALAADECGNVWVTGRTCQSTSFNQFCMTTVEYSYSGEQLGTNTQCSTNIHPDAEGRAVAVLASGYGCPVGKVGNASNNADGVLILCRAAGCGTWCSLTHDGPGHGEDSFNGVAANSSGIYAVGERWNGSNYDVVLVKQRLSIQATPVTADTWIGQGSSAPNGSDPSLCVRNRYGATDGWECDALVKFSITGIPAGTPVMASLRLYYYGYTDNDPVNRKLPAHRVTSTWTESSTIWPGPSYVANPTDRTCITAGSGWVEWDVTNDVQAIVNGAANNGWEIRDDQRWGTTNIPISKFRAREFMGAAVPVLVVALAPSSGLVEDDPEFEVLREEGEAEPGVAQAADRLSLRMAAIPGGGASHFELYLPEAGMVRFEILDITGRVVRTLLREERPKGQVSITWDGRDDRGVSASTGVYFCRLAASGKTLTRSLIRIR